MNHSMGRMSLDYWAHKHFQLFGRNPTVLGFFKKTYMSDHPTEAIEASSQTDQSERSEETREFVMNANARRILAKLNISFEEAIKNGLEEEEANMLALTKVLGKSRLHSVITSKTINETSSKRKRTPNPDIEIEDLKEQLEQEKNARQKLEDKLNVQEETAILEKNKREELNAQLQMLASHVGFKSLMAQPSSNTNDELSDHRVPASEPSVDNI